MKYKREDGTTSRSRSTRRPATRRARGCPTILYAYPLDYADPSKAGQVSGSEQTFTRLRQYRLLLLAGYAIIDNAAFPIVGDPQKAYDTYLEQLVADAQGGRRQGGANSAWPTPSASASPATATARS